MSASPLPIAVRQLDALQPPKLAEVLAIENEAFPPCERLGGPLLQHHAKLRTSGLLVGGDWLGGGRLPPVFKAGGHGP